MIRVSIGQGLLLLTVASTLAVEGEDKGKGSLGNSRSNGGGSGQLSRESNKKLGTTQPSFGIQECFHSNWSGSNIGWIDFGGNVFPVGDISMTLNNGYSIGDKYWKTFP